MNPSLLLGIIIGMGAVLFCFGIFIAISTKRTSKANQLVNEKSLDELIKRNGIGHEQLAALWKICGCLAPKDTRAADRNARRERIATVALAHIPALMDSMDQNPSYYNICHHAVMIADEMIQQLDKPEP